MLIVCFLCRIWPDYQATVYCGAVWKGGDAMWDFIMKEYAEPTVTQRQQGLLRNALACRSDADKLAG